MSPLQRRGKHPSKQLYEHPYHLRQHLGHVAHHRCQQRQLRSFVPMKQSLHLKHQRHYLRL